MKILVTGGKGFLGTRIETALRADGHDLTVTDREELDVLELDQIENAIEQIKPDLVMHLAALCGAPPSVANPHEFFTVNHQGTVNALEACRRKGVKDFLFTSSLTVFGATQGDAVREDSVFAPRHPYASAKACGELACRIYTEKYGFRTLILRPTLVVGENYKEPHAIGDFVATVESGEPIVLFGSGAHRRDFMHPEDVGSGVALAVKRFSQLEPGQLESYNFSSGEVFSMNELADLVISELGRGEKEYANPTAQTFSLFCDPAPAREVLGWEPKFKVKDIIHKVKKGD